MSVNILFCWAIISSKVYTVGVASRWLSYQMLVLIVLYDLLGLKFKKEL